MTIRRRLNTYVCGVVMVAALLVVWLARGSAFGAVHVELLSVLALAGVLIIGELRPIRISHGDGSVDQVTISSSFSLALVLHGPLAFAVVAQAIATLVDDLRQRKDVRRIIFNQAQYVITLVAARVVYATLAGHGLLHDSRELRAGEIGPALAAAVVFFVVNHVITTVAIALSLGENPWQRMPV
ncbi:MAG: hypothetical protein QOJ62_2206, partial [Actinomycetota bacterium]|nr:hypothetical protein [Actinomycetota bacterium]